MSEIVRSGGSFTMVSTGGAVMRTSGISREEAPHKVAKADPGTDGTEKMIPWGTNNRLPKELVDDARKNTVLLPGIRFKTKMQYGGGPTHGLIDIDDATGKEVFIPKREPEVVKFFRNSGNWLFTALYDLNYFGIAFPLFHLSKDKKKITRISLDNTRAKNCRFTPKGTDGEFDKVVVKPELSYPSARGATSVTYDCAPTHDVCEWIEEKKDLKAFVIPIRMVDSGNAYYPEPDWNSARTSLWMEIARHIAEFKKFIITNQITLKYHIEIDQDYWPARFGAKQWDKWNDDKRVAEVRKEFDFMSDWLTKPENQGKSLMTQLKKSKNVTDKQLSLVKFTAIENKFSKDGVYIEDSKEASDHIISALGSHKDLVGSSPGNTLGSGSGSGSRVAFNQRVSMSKDEQDLVLAPLYVVAEHNKWLEGLEFRIRTSLITTLDTGAEATKPKAEA